MRLIARHERDMDARFAEVFTLAGSYSMIRNPDRRWWQFWKPRWVESGKLVPLRVVR